MIQIDGSWIAGPCLKGQLLVERAISAEALFLRVPPRQQLAASRALGSTASQGAVSGWCHGIFIWRRFHMPRLEWK